MWLDRILCAVSGHMWRWPYRDGELMRTRCGKCGYTSRGVVIQAVHPCDMEEIDEMPEGA